MHCHALGKGTDITKTDTEVYYNAEDNQHWFTRLLHNLLEKDLAGMRGDRDSGLTISTDEYFMLVYGLLASSEEIDRVVLLALDAVYRDSALDALKTDLWVSNRFLACRVRRLNAMFAAETDPAKKAKGFYLGASVNPNGPRPLEALDEAASNPDTVLLKWIPSAQHIRAADVPEEFYRRLAECGLPLLCHVGPEYSFPEGIRNMALDHFSCLRKPLDLGVKVIAAHCASPVFPLIDQNVIPDFYRMMEEYNRGGDVRLWADTSALSLSTRLPVIPEILRTFPPEWLLHGTDFPIPIDGWPHLPFVNEGVGPKDYRRIVRTKNPFDRDVRIKRSHGFSDAVLENAEKVLRLPR